MPVDLQQAAAILKKRQSSDDSDGGLRWFKLPDDTTPCIIRFYPPTIGPVPGTLIYRHYGTTPSSLCFKTWDMECPSCEKLKLYEDQIDIDDFSSVGKSFFNVQILGNPTCDESLPYILGTSEYSYYWLLEQLINPMVGDITEPNVGHDVIFTRTGFKKAFNRTIGLQARPLAATPELIKEMLKKAYDFTKIWKKPDDEALQKAVAVADELEATIKERLLSLSSPQVTVPVVEAPVVPPVVEAPVVPPVVEAPVVEAPVVPPVVEAPVVPLVVNKPVNAPECFGQKTKYDEDSKTCMICPFEFDCSESLAST